MRMYPYLFKHLAPDNSNTRTREFNSNPYPRCYSNPKYFEKQIKITINDLCPLYYARRQKSEK